MKLCPALLASTVLACGGSGGNSSEAAELPPWATNPGGTIAFEPTLVSAVRYPSTSCGVVNPPFLAGDIYSLDIVDQTGPAPYNGLSLSFNSPLPPIGTPLMLMVQPFSMQGSGMGIAPTTWYATQSALGSGLNFLYSQGTNPAKIDTGAFDAVTITILAMPTANGEPLTVRIRAHFVDGRVLDETFSSPLRSASIGCAAG